MDMCTPWQTTPSLHPHTLTLKPLLFSLNLLHCAPPPSALPIKSFHIHTLSLLCSCRRSVVHPPLLVPILPPLPSLPLSTSLYWRFRSATACRGHCGRCSQNDSRHSSTPSLTPSSILPSCNALSATPLSLHSVGAVAPVVHCGGDGHNDSRHSISCQVEVLSPGVLALEHLYQHDVELHPFQEHPGEGCQEEEMEQGCEDCTGNLAWKRKDGEDLKIQ